MSWKPGFNPGSNRILSHTGELFFARPQEKRTPAPRSGGLENLGCSLKNSNKKLHETDCMYKRRALDHRDGWLPPSSNPASFSFVHEPLQS